MKHLQLPSFIGAAFLVSALAACQTSSQSNNHWHIDSVSTSVKHHFFGTVPTEWPVFKEEVLEGAEHIGTTLRRHFLNSNPDNPLQPESRSRARSWPQPPEREFTVGG